LACDKNFGTLPAQPTIKIHGNSAAVVSSKQYGHPSAKYH